MKKDSNGKKVLIADSKDPFFFSSQMAILWFSFENFFIYTPNLLLFWFVVMRKNVRVTGSSAMFVVKIFGNDITWRVTWQPIKTEKKKRAWLMWMWTWVWILTKMFIIDYYARLLFFIVSSAMFVVKIFGNGITWRVTWQPIKTEKKKQAWLMLMWTWVWILTNRCIIDYYVRCTGTYSHSKLWLWKNNKQQLC